MVVASSVSAAEDLEARLDFAREIQPILKNKCSRCHSGHKSEGGLSMNTRGDLLKGGDSGPAIVVKKSAASAIIQRITSSDPDERMPEGGAPLEAEQVALLRRWIDDGAIWPAGSVEVAANAPEPHNNMTRKLTIDPVEDWALQPRRIFEPPVIEDARWAASPIDRFLEFKRRDSGIQADGNV